MPRHPCLLLACAWTVACGGSQADDPVGDAIARYEESREGTPARSTASDAAGRPVPPPATSPRPSTTIGGDDAPAPAPAARRPGGRGQAEVRARRGGRVDVRFVDADLVNALRLLAERAAIDLVVAPDVDGTVTLTLRDVDPVDALAEIARANGATVERRDGVYVVRAAR